MQQNGTISAGALSEEERSKLEDRIIAHFDGSLDEAGSNQLVNEVMASPEKRALFRAHETLNRVISAARVPMEAPLETRREIAEKIPGLIAFIPGLIGTAATAPVIQQSINPILAFFSRMSLTTAVSIGGAVAVLTTVGIIASNNSGNNSNSSTPKSAQVQQAVPQSSNPQNFAMTAAPSGTNSAATNTIRSNNVTSNNVTSNNRSSNVISSNNASTSSARRNGLTSHTAKAVKSTQNGSENNSSSNSFASDNENNSTSNSTMNDHIAPGKEPVSEVPTIANPNMEAKPTAEAVADIPMQKGIMTEIPDEVDQSIAVRPFAAYGTTTVWLNGVTTKNQFQKMPSTTFGVEFDLGDRWTARVQGGTSAFAEITPVQVGSLPTLFGGTPTPEYGPGMYAKEAGWATVGMSYSFQTFFAPIIVGGNIGEAFTAPNRSLLGTASLGTEIAVSNWLALQPTVNLNLIETSTSLSSLPDGVYDGTTSSSMWASSFGFQLNFVFRP